MQLSDPNLSDWNRLANLSYKELQQRCRDNGLKSGGSTVQLKARIIAYEATERRLGKRKSKRKAKRKENDTDGLDEFARLR